MFAGLLVHFGRAWIALAPIFQVPIFQVPIVRAWIALAPIAQVPVGRCQGDYFCPSWDLCPVRHAHEIFVPVLLFAGLSRLVSLFPPVWLLPQGAQPDGQRLI